MKNISSLLLGLLSSLLLTVGLVRVASLRSHRQEFVQFPGLRSQARPDLHDALLLGLSGEPEVIEIQPRD